MAQVAVLLLLILLLMLLCLLTGCSWCHDLIVSVILITLMTVIATDKYTYKKSSLLHSSDYRCVRCQMLSASTVLVVRDAQWAVAVAP